MRSLIVLATLIALAAPAHASGGEEAPASTDGDPSAVEMPMLVAPVTVKDRLYHYAYMRVILKAKSPDIAHDAQDRIAFILDAMLREVHRASIALGDNPDEIDGNGLKSRLLKAANSVMGEGNFVALNFRDTIQTDDPVANQKIAEQAEIDALMKPAPKAEAKASGGH